MAAEDEDFRAGFYGDEFTRFDDWGEQSVRGMLSSGKMAPKDLVAALVWLGEKDRLAISTQARALAAAETAAAAAVVQASAATRQAETAVRQAIIARNANKLGMIAIAISVIWPLVLIVIAGALHSK